MKSHKIQQFMPFTFYVLVFYNEQNIHIGKPHDPSW